MAIAMALYVAQNSFSNLRKNANQAKAMLDSWVIRDNPRDDQENKPTFNQTPGRIYELGNSGTIPQNPNNPNRQNDIMKENMWLFGGIKQ
jgi:hypothetical protein